MSLTVFVNFTGKEASSADFTLLSCLVGESSTVGNWFNILGTNIVLNVEVILTKQTNSELWGSVSGGLVVNLTIFIIISSFTAVNGSVVRILYFIVSRRTHITTSLFGGNSIQIHIDN